MPWVFEGLTLMEEATIEMEPMSQTTKNTKYTLVGGEHIHMILQLAPSVKGWNTIICNRTLC